MLSIKPQFAGLQSIDGYSGNSKEIFHKEGKAFLRDVAKELGLEKGTYEIRSNMGGPAVSGEVTLHSDTLYVQLSESCVGGPGVGILFRACRGRADYSGLQNHWMTLRHLFQHVAERERWIEGLKRLGGLA
jgi:hypothetical protein